MCLIFHNNGFFTIKIIKPNSHQPFNLVFRIFNYLIEQYIYIEGVYVRLEFYFDL